MATNATDALTAHGTKTAVPIFSAPKDSIAARLRAVTYSPATGTAAAWDAAQWNYAALRAAAQAADRFYTFAPSDETYRAMEEAGEAEEAAHTALMEMPAPHGRALLWKLLHVLEVGSDNHTNSWRVDVIKPVIDDAARFAASDVQPTRLHSEWSSARARYVEAREGETAAGVANDMAAEDRWTKRRHDAEDVLMAIPSPDPAAFAFKYLVAHGDGRETDCWNAMLEAEAARFAEQEA